jgi:hypothetical protein
MKTRLSRLALALGLLAVIWPAFATLLGASAATLLGMASAHPAVLVALAAAVLLAGTVPGPVDRALTRLVRTTPERTAR